MASVPAAMVVYSTGKPSWPRPSWLAALRNIFRFEPTRSAAVAGQTEGTMKSLTTESATAVLTRPNWTGTGSLPTAISKGSDSGADSRALKSRSVRVCRGIEADLQGSGERPDHAAEHPVNRLDPVGDSPGESEVRAMISCRRQSTPG